MDVHAPTTEPTARRIDPGTTMGPVTLRVADLARAQEFYEHVLGLRASDRADGTAVLGAPGGVPMVRLHGDTSASGLDRRAPGLYHLAILMPDRASLAMALARLASLGWPLDGASDHLVSEALYLSDPEGNGIEIYRDRPRQEWRYENGQLAMSTLPLNLDNLLAELAGNDQIEPTAPAGARIGHVHLQVADLAPAEEFYAGVLGFEVIIRGYPGALFIAAGSYHHHLGLNTWQTRSGSQREPASAGLEHFEILLPDGAELKRLVAGLRSAGLQAEPRPEGCLTADPSGNRLLLRSP
jgi:catechol 2,3-dioxygenase